MAGEEVEVLYQDNNLKGTTTKLDDNDVIYGINKTGNTVVYNITKGDLQDSDSANNKIKFGDVSYDATAQIDVYENYTAAVKKNVDQFDKGTASAEYTGNSADTIKFIVDDQTGKIDTAYVLNKTVGAITTLTSSKVAIRGLAGSAVQDIEEKNIVLYDGAAKGDIVYFYTQFTGEEVETIVEKATTVSGTVSAIRDTSTITINGTNYKMGVAADGQNNIDAEDYDEAVPTVGEEYEVVLYGNYWIGAKALTEASKDYAMVLGSSHNTVTGDTVKLLLADGTTQVMTVHEKSTYKPEESVSGANATLVAYTTTDDGVKLTQIKSGSDDFTLAATAGKKADYDKKTQTLTVDQESSGTKKYITASNAVAFVYNDSEWKAYSIAQLGDVKGTANTAVYGRTNDNGYATVFAMTADSISGISGADDLVGFVLDDGVTTKDGDDTIISFQVWDGTAEKTVKFLSTDKGDMKAGQYIKIEDFNADTKYDGTNGTGDVTYYTAGTAAAYNAIAANTHAIVKVKDFDAARKVIVITDETYADGKVTPGADGDKSLPLADDYKVIGVTSDENNRGGYETSDVPSYTQVDSASKANAMIILNGDGEVAYIFIDSDNVITVK